MEKVWLNKSYPKDVPHEIDPSFYGSIVEMFDTYTQEYKDNTAFINMGSSITYNELASLAEDFAAYLQQTLGLKKGDKFAIMSPNLLQYPIAVFGALKAGLTVVNVNPLYTPRELSHQLSDSGADGILIIENYAHVLENVLQDPQFISHENNKLKHIITTRIGDRLSPVKGALINFVLKRIKKMVPDFDLPNAVNFNTALKLGARQTLAPVKVEGADLAFLQYTGGTTGVSKGVMLTHQNMIANIEQSKAMTTPIYEKGKEFMVTALPLYHIFALTANCLSFMPCGGTNLLITNPKDMPGFVKELSKYKFTVVTGVNTLFNGLLHTPGFADLDFSHLKISFAGGMATQRPVAEHWVKVTGSHLLEGYGLTECAPTVTLSPYNQSEYNGSIGLPAASTDIKLLDDNGNEVPMGEPGEMWVKGPQVMQGYYQRPEATSEVLQDGWLATGDIATADDDGFFYIVDRKKDMIIVSGFNVFPNEIEEVLVMHDDILEAAAVAAPCDVTGEKVKVYLVVSNDSLTKEDVVAHCQKHLTKYKCPKDIEFMDDLPKSNVGKILRKELRALQKAS